jgi:D-alanine-D-alanine ligase-like ATP-grasp enzyme
MTAFPINQDEDQAPPTIGGDPFSTVDDQPPDDVISFPRDEPNEPPGESRSATRQMAEIARELGLDVEVEPNFGRVGCLTFADGRRSFFRGTSVDLNGLASSHVARDKGWALEFLARLGYGTPRSGTFFSDEFAARIGSPNDIHAAWDFAREIGLPVIVKPNSKSAGRGVSLAGTKRDFYRAMRAIFGPVRDQVALVQEVVDGRDYRVVVLDGEVVFAYERRSLSVVGDGTSTVSELIEAKQREFQRRWRRAPGLEDRRIQMFMRTRRIRGDHIVPEGQALPVLPNANLSTGGDATDVSDEIGADLRRLCVQIVAGMGLRLAGLDMLVRQDLAQPLVPGAITVLELNASPGFDHYASLGETERQRVRDIHRRILIALRDGRS